MKRAGTSGTAFIAATLLVGVVVFAPFGVAALVTTPPASWQAAVLILGSAALQVGYFMLLQRGYRLADVGVVYPVARGVGPLLSVAAAVAVLGERPALLALGGAILVVAGVVTIGTAGVGTTAADPARRWRGVRYGVAVGVVIAAYTLWDASAVTVADLNPVGYYWLSMIVQLIVLGGLAARAPATAVATVRAHPIAAIIVGLLSPLAYVAVLFAYQLAPVSIVAPAREVSVVLIALAGWMLFREPNPVRRLFGSAVVLGGIALLALG